MTQSTSYTIDLALNGLSRRTIRLAKRAGEWGCQGLWFPETDHDPFLPIPLLAEGSEPMLLGTRIALAFTRSPMTLAYMAWDLAQFTGGRFFLGLGTQVKGHNERRFSVEWTPPGPRLREIIKSLHHIWDVFQGRRDKLEFQGDHYSFSLMTDFFNPGPIATPDIPIYIAGLNSFHLQLAGERCDGLHMHPFNTPSYTKEVVLKQVEKGCRKTGRTLEDVTITASPFLITGINPTRRDRCREDVRKQIAFYGSTRTYSSVWRHIDREELGKKLHGLSVRGEWEQMPSLITDEILNEFAIDAPLDQMVAAVNKAYGKFIDRLVMSHQHVEPDVLEALARRFSGH